MLLAASKQWRNFVCNGLAMILFAVASPIYRPHRRLRLSFGASNATPKFGLPWKAQATWGGFVRDAPGTFRI